jgi:HEAT repeat protein
MPWLLIGGVAVGSLILIGVTGAILIGWLRGEPAGGQNVAANTSLDKSSSDTSSSNPNGSDDVTQALDDLANGPGEARAAALDWLAKATPRDEARDRVTAAIEPLIFEGGDRRGLSVDRLLRAYLRWADPRNIPAMIRMIDDPPVAEKDRRDEHRRKVWDANDVRMVMQALGNMKAKQAIGSLVSRLPDPALRNEAVSALRQIGPSAKDAVLDYLFDPDPQTRMRASDLLASYGTSPGVVAGAALDRLKSNTPAVKLAAAAWCGENGPANDKQKADGAAVLVKLLDGLDPHVNGTGLRALKLWATKDNLPQFLEYSRRLAESPRTPETNSNAALLIQTLAQFREASAATGIAVQLPNDAVRAEASQALLTQGAVAVDAVLSLINDPDPAVNKEARRLAGSFNVSEDRKIQQTLADVASERRSVARTALEHLSKMRPDETHRPAVSKALNASLGDSSADIVETALDAVAVWGTQENAGALLRLFPNFSDGKARPSGQKVSNALIAIGPTVEDEVQRYLKSPDHALRCEACRILGEVGTKKSLRPLEEAGIAFRDKDPEFAKQTAVAGRKIELRK